MLPPGRQCAESDDDVRGLSVFMEAIEQAQEMDRQIVRERAAEVFDTERIVDSVIAALHTASQKVSQFADVRPVPWRKELPTV